MYSRRRYLGFLTAVSGVTIAGCSGTGKDSNQVDGSEPHSVGKPVTYGGLEMAVSEYKTVREFTEVTNDGDERDTQTSPPGAVFLLVNVVLKNVGDTEREAPSERNIGMVYKDETVSREPFIDMKIDSEIHPDYDKDYDRGLFPGTTIEGWVVFRVPERFNVSDAVVSIERGGIGGGDVDRRTFRWRLG